MQKSMFLNTSQFESEAHHDNKICEILGVIANPNNPNDISIMDAECMPQFKIRFIDSGEEYTAYPEEIPESDWGPEMKACLDGLHGKKKPDDNELVIYWQYGIEITSYK